MICSSEHRALERRLKRQWKKTLCANQRKPRRGTADFAPRARKFFNSGPFWRLVILTTAFWPFPQSWATAVSFATMATIIHASQLASRGSKEALISLYGASDKSIQSLIRRWTRGIALLSMGDAAVYLGIWYFTGRIPWWAVVLGIPTYVTAAVIGPWLLKDAIPPRFLAYIVAAISFLPAAMIFVITREGVSPAFINSIIWFLGALSPAGWTILMLHEIIAGQWYLLAVVPLLAAGVWVARIFAREQEQELLNLVCSEKAFYSEPPEEADQTKTEGSTFARELASTRTIGGLEFPDSVSVSVSWRRLVFTVVAILVVACIVRLEIVLSENLRHIALALALLAAYVFWLPVLGMPVWLRYTFLSINRVASCFILYPISLRTVLWHQVRADLKTIGKVFPFLLVVSVAAFALAYPISGSTALICGFGLSLLAVLKVPLRWFHFAVWPLAPVPFGFSNILRGTLTVLVALVLLTEFVCVIFYLIAAVSGVIGIAVPWFLGLSLLNALLGLLGFYTNLWSYEKKLQDVVKSPPKDS